MCSLALRSLSGQDEGMYSCMQWSRWSQLLAPHLGLRIQVGRVSRDSHLHRPSLHGNHSHRDAPQPARQMHTGSAPGLPAGRSQGLGLYPVCCQACPGRNESCKWGELAVRQRSSTKSLRTMQSYKCPARVRTLWARWYRTTGAVCSSRIQDGNSEPHTVPHILL